MKIYPITKNLIDVFIGEGWKNWGRYRRENHNWVLVAGKHPSRISKEIPETWSKQ